MNRLRGHGALRDVNEALNDQELARWDLPDDSIAAPAARRRGRPAGSRSTTHGEPDLVLGSAGDKPASKAWLKALDFPYSQTGNNAKRAVLSCQGHETANGEPSAAASHRPE